MQHKLPELPYAKNALEPHMSAETLEYHHGKHHRKYVDTLNELIPGSEFEDMPLEQIITTAGSGKIFNQAAQVWNHSFFWKCLSPEGGGAPGGELGEAIDTSFGSFDDFKSQFTDAAKELFGSGWVWLVKTGPDILSVEATKDAENPLVHGNIALLTCDVWEHAFYIDYRNDKGSYMDGFWKLVNWEYVAARLAEQAPVTE